KGIIMARDNVSKTKRKTRKPYSRPKLKKGPTLSNSAVLQKVSGRDECWIARAAFGADDFRWLIFRDWLVNDAPAWFRRAYMRFGPGLGGWLEGRHRTRGFARNIMLPVIRRKISG
ncbi:MAG: hypothetical protein O7E53_00250, partial [Alphaproteobacteria bacterium]|nr:hypothetical protein [Alphaproteobacteria bacterium]